MRRETEAYPEIFERFKTSAFGEGYVPIWDKKNSRRSLFSDCSLKSVFGKGINCPLKRPDFLNKNTHIKIKENTLNVCVVVEVKGKDDHHHMEEAESQLKEYSGAILDYKKNCDYVIGIALLWDNDTGMYRERRWVFDRSETDPRLIDRSEGEHKDWCVGQKAILSSFKEFLCSSDFVEQQPSLTNNISQQTLKTFCKQYNIGFSTLQQYDVNQSWNDSVGRKIGNPNIPYLKDWLKRPQKMAIKMLTPYVNQLPSTQKNQDREYFYDFLQTIPTKHTTSDVSIIRIGGERYVWVYLDPVGTGKIHYETETHKRLTISLSAIDWSKPLFDNFDVTKQSSNVLLENIGYVRFEDLFKTTDSLEVIARRLIVYEVRQYPLAQTMLLEIFNSEYNLDGKNSKVRGVMKGHWKIKGSDIQGPLLPFNIEKDGWFPRGSDRQQVEKYYDDKKKKYPKAPRYFSLNNTSFYDNGKEKAKVRGVAKCAIVPIGKKIVDVLNNKEEIIGTIEIDCDNQLDVGYIRSFVTNACTTLSRTVGQIYDNVPVATIKKKLIIPLVDLKEDGSLNQIIPVRYQKMM